MRRGSANAPSQYVCVQPCMVKRRKRFEEGRKDGGAGGGQGPGREGGRVADKQEETGVIDQRELRGVTSS